MLLKRLLEGPRRALRTYLGAKVVGLGIAVLTLLPIALLGFARITAPTPTDRLSLIAQYALAWWATHAWFLLLLGLLYLVVFLLNMLRYGFHAFVRRPTPEPTDQQLHARWRIYFVIVSVGAAIAALLGLPAVHLSYSHWTPWLLALVLSSGIVVTYLDVYQLQVGLFAQRRRLTAFAFDARHFNAASLGPECDQSNAEIVLYMKRRGMGIGNPTYRTYITHGEPYARWRGNDAFIRLLAETVGRPPSSLELFDRTGHAIQHALLEIQSTAEGVDARHGPDRIKLLCTDADYHTVTGSIDSLSREVFDVVRVKGLRDSIWAEESDQYLIDLIVTAARTLRRVNVLVLLHVDNETGRVLPARDILKRLKEETLYSEDEDVVVIDGAQAVGNVAVMDAPLLAATTYYAFCTHKWLSSLGNLGVLVRGESRSAKQVSRLPSTRGLSRILGSGQEPWSGTADLSGHIGCNVICSEIHRIGGLQEIERHNTELVRVFVSELRASGVPWEVRYSGRGGICNLMVGDPAVLFAAQERLQRAGFLCTPIPERDALRFSIHFYHSENDVVELAEAIREVSSDREVVRLVNRRLIDRTSG